MFLKTKVTNDPSDVPKLLILVVREYKEEFQEHI